MAAFYAFPRGAKKLSGLLHLHGGGPAGLPERGRVLRQAGLRLLVDLLADQARRLNPVHAAAEVDVHEDEVGLQSDRSWGLLASIRPVHRLERKRLHPTKVKPPKLFPPTVRKVKEIVPNKLIPKLKRYH